MFEDKNVIKIDKPCISEQEFIEFMLERNYNENMFNKDGTLYQCPNCGDFVFIGHTCKSRLCTSCGYKYKMKELKTF